MSAPRLFYVALALVAVAAAVPILAAQAFSSNVKFEAPLSPVLTRTSSELSEFRTQMASLRDMHERLTAAKSESELQALMAQSERVMSEGVTLMHRQRLGLGPAVAESAEIRTEFITQAESNRITDYLGLMELLVQLKEDRDAIAMPATPSLATEPSAIQSLTRTPARNQALACVVTQNDCVPPADLHELI